MRIILLLIVIPLFYMVSCNQSENQKKAKTHDLEVEVINSAFSQILPSRPVGCLAPIENESRQEYLKRDQKYLARVDSAGKEIEIVRCLYGLDSNYCELALKEYYSNNIQLLCNAPRHNRIVKSTFINKTNHVRHIYVNEPRSEIGGSVGGSYSLGRIEFSRVGFNCDSTKAVFQYFIDDGSCQGGSGGIVQVEKVNKKWRIVKSKE